MLRSAPSAFEAAAHALMTMMRTKAETAEAATSNQTIRGQDAMEYLKPSVTGGPPRMSRTARNQGPRSVVY